MCVHSIITRLQLKKMSVMYESAHDAITFVITCNEFFHNTQPETISNTRTRYIFQRVFIENIGDLMELHNEKNQSGSYV